MSFPRLKTLLCLLFCAILCVSALGEPPKTSPNHPEDVIALGASPEEAADETEAGASPEETADEAEAGASPEEAAGKAEAGASPVNPLDIVPALNAFALAARDLWLEWLWPRTMDVEAFADACRADIEALPSRLGGVQLAAEAQAEDGRSALRLLAERLNGAMETADPTADLRALLTLLDGQRDAAVDEFASLREKTASLFDSLW